MKDFDAQRLFLFAAVVLGTFLAFVGLGTAVTRHADILNSRLVTMPVDQGLPQPLQGYPSLANAWLSNTASASTAQVWILGTSISLMGLDPCSMPATANFARSSAQVRDMLKWAGQAAQANDHVRTLIVELSLAEPQASVRDNVGRRALTLVLSLQKIAAGPARTVTSGPDRSCVSFLDDADRPLLPVPILSRDQLVSHSRAALEAAAGVARWCAADAGRRLIFHLPPVRPVVVETQPGLDAALADVTETMKTLVADLARQNPDCRVSFHAPSGAGSTADDWMDNLHFRTSLGGRLLGDMLYPPSYRDQTTPN
jgi:hypothetical protein